MLVNTLGHYYEKNALHIQSIPIFYVASEC